MGYEGRGVPGALGYLPEGPGGTKPFFQCILDLSTNLAKRVSNSVLDFWLNICNNVQIDGFVGVGTAVKALEVSISTRLYGGRSRKNQKLLESVKKAVEESAEC